MTNKLKILLIAVSLTVLVTGCGKDEKSGYYAPLKDGASFSYNNMTIDVPKSVTKAESIGVFGNDHESSKAYKSDTEKHLLFAEMDSYYLCSFHMDLASYKKDAFSTVLKRNADVWVTDAKHIGAYTQPGGIKKELYKVTAQVTPCRDLFADMTGYIAVLTYRNDVWISADLAVDQDKSALAVARSIRITDPSVDKKAYTIDDAIEREASSKNVTELDQWGTIRVMNKKNCGENTLMLAKVTNVYDENDSYGLISNHAADLEAHKYTLDEDKKGNVAHITRFYGSIDREEYDPYIDVKITDDRGKVISRTYTLFEEGDDLYVFYEHPEESGYSIKVGNSDSMIVKTE